MLVSSDGGHLAQILELKDMFTGYDYLLVTEKTPATLFLKETLNVRYLKKRSGNHKRGIQFFFVLLLNSLRSLRLLAQHFPKVIITTGSHTAVPICILGKIIGVKIVWILSFARVNSRAFAADLIYPIADKFIIQWPEVQNYYKKGIYLGGIY